MPVGERPNVFVERWLGQVENRHLSTGRVSTEKMEKASTDNLVTLGASPQAIHDLAPYKTLEVGELRQRIAAVR